MSDDLTPHRRRPRYRGKNPRRFEEKYKEHEPARYAETIEKVLAAGKTPAGSHRPIMLAEVLEKLAPCAGEIAVDCTLGYGGHACEILPRLLPNGRLLGLDVDPFELPRTEARLRALGYNIDNFRARLSNFAGLSKAMAAEGIEGADLILADLGVSSMQLDDPARGFSYKLDGPLDLRMNPSRGESASQLLGRIEVEDMEALLVANADEPFAKELAAALVGKTFATATALSRAVRLTLARHSDAASQLALRRVFQALRIAVNDEFAVLDALLRQLPYCLRGGGRVAILSFHSGEDRRVKKAFAEGIRVGHYIDAANTPLRPTATECHANPRATSAKLRWAIRAS